MIYWIALLFVILTGLTLEFFANKNEKRWFVFFVAFVLSYFSAFRNGLGGDYEGYKYVIQEAMREFGLREPGYTLLAWVSSSGYFDYTLFFAIMAFATNFLVVYSYSRSRMFSVAVLTYFCYSILYFNTFNLVRQYLAASIFLYASAFAINGKFSKYAFSIAIASLFHLSALVLIPVYFLRQKKISFSLVSFTIIISHILAHVNILPNFLHFFSGFGYDHYLASGDAVVGERIGMVAIYFNVLLLYMTIIVDRNKIGDIENFTMLMFLLCVVLYNLMPLFFYFYRLSIFFLLFFPLFITIPVKKNYEKMHVFVSLMSSFVIFFYFLLTSIDNEKVMPTSLKPFWSIFGGSF